MDLGSLTHGIAFGATKHRQGPFPFSPTITPDLVLKPAEKLFKELAGTAPFKINNISLGFHGLGAMEQGQQGIAGFLKPNKRAREEDDAPQEAADVEPLLLPAVQARKPSLLPVPSARRSISAVPMESASSSRGFHCPRCKKAISLSTRVEATEERLYKLRAEHEDFHVAQDLAREVIDVSSDDDIQVIETKKPPAKKAKTQKTKKKEGIAAYFKSSSGPSTKKPR